jgi:hypothetical protein
MRFDLPPEWRQHAAGQRNGQQAEAEPDYAGSCGFHEPCQKCVRKGHGARDAGPRVMKRMAGAAKSELQAMKEVPPPTQIIAAGPRQTRG